MSTDATPAKPSEFSIVEVMIYRDIQFDANGKEKDPRLLEYEISRPGGTMLNPPFVARFVGYYTMDEHITQVDPVTGQQVVVGKRAKRVKFIFPSTITDAATAFRVYEATANKHFEENFKQEKLAVPQKSKLLLPGM